VLQLMLASKKDGDNMQIKKRTKFLMHTIDYSVLGGPNLFFTNAVKKIYWLTD
jgi:hypothetical protein